MRKTYSVIALLLSLLTILSFSAFSVSAAESSEVEESVVAVISGEESAVEDSVAEDSATEDSATEDSVVEESDAETSDAETSVVEESAEESVAEESKEDDENNKSASSAKDDGESYLTLIVFIALLVIFALVCFICIKRENRFGLWLKKFFKDYKSELKKIVWASKDFTVKSTIVVIVCLLVCAGVIGLLDFGLSKLLLWLLSLVG
ncbi:MAG: preprotein translocase subunit SecE [Clostridia bacterium]|nr:preprotein translocase subunit SecE [Clostridia bacterium]